MILAPKLIRHTTHPFIDSAYIAEHGDRTKVLVINAVRHVGRRQRSRLYSDFLARLDAISRKMKREGGSFDRVDIHFGG